MNGIIFGTFCTLALVLPSYGQFFDGDCSVGRTLVDPFLMQALKSKYPKKFKMDKVDKDLALDAKYRLGAAKLLARHMKNLNSINNDIQTLMYQQQQQQQPGLLQSMITPDQSALLAQQQQQQQQQLASYQIPYDAARSYGLTQQPDAQLSCYQQVTDPRLQQQAYQLAAAQSTRSTRQPSPCSCEEDGGCQECEAAGSSPRGDVLSSVLSAFVGVFKNILK